MYTPTIQPRWSVVIVSGPDHERDARIDSCLMARLRREQKTGKPGIAPAICGPRFRRQDPGRLVQHCLRCCDCHCPTESFAERLGQTWARSEHTRGQGLAVPGEDKLVRCEGRATEAFFEHRRYFKWRR